MTSESRAGVEGRASAHAAAAWWSLELSCLPRSIRTSYFGRAYAEWAPPLEAEGHAFPLVDVLEAGLVAHLDGRALLDIVDSVVEAARATLDVRQDASIRHHAAFIRLARTSLSDPSWRVARAAVAAASRRDPSVAARMRQRLTAVLLRDCDIAWRAGGLARPAFDPPSESESRGRMPGMDRLAEDAALWAQGNPEQVTAARGIHDLWVSESGRHAANPRRRALDVHDLMEVLNAAIDPWPWLAVEPCAVAIHQGLRAELQGSLRPALRKLLRDRLRRLSSRTAKRRVESGPLRSIEPIRVGDRYERILPSEFALPAAYRRYALLDDRLLGYRRESRRRESRRIHVVVALVRTEAPTPPGPDSAASTSRFSAHDLGAFERGLAAVLSETLVELVAGLPDIETEVRCIEIGQVPDTPRVGLRGTWRAVAARDAHGAARPIWERQSRWAELFARDLQPLPTRSDDVERALRAYLAAGEPAHEVVVTVGDLDVRSRDLGAAVCARVWMPTGSGSAEGRFTVVRAAVRRGPVRATAGLRAFDAHELAVEAAAHALADVLERLS